MSELKLLQCRLDGRYDVEECLGRGSYAEIYAARDLAATDERFRQVVIKALNVLLQGYQDLELEHTLIQNFQNEAIALDRVRHPNIISRLGHGTALDLNGTAFHYIVLEFLSGGDLSALARRAPLTLETALFYLQQVCSGLAHAHESGVIHRDIKPQNLLLTADHQIVKIADFGVARLEASEGAITRVGTNIYAAPEHSPLLQTAELGTASLSSERLTPAADIYSLAKTAYTLICGLPPRRFAHEPVTELPEHLASKPWAESLLAVFEHATQTRPAERYQTVQEFWDELSDAMLPPTRELHAVEPRRGVTSDLNLAAVATAAPPRPRFESSQELREEPAANGARPRIVVAIANQNVPAAVAPAPTFGGVQQQPGRVTVAVQGGGQKPAQVEPAPKRSTRLRAILVSVVLIIAFAGMLLATRNYIRNRWVQQQTQQTGPIGREALTTTDLNLRAGPSSANDRVGVAAAGSRVKVLSISGTNANWCEVQVLEHSRPKTEPSSQDRGWVNRQYLKFE
ncbi:MAG TPA: serine/threonine protein kinase [Pyrinomonadaceae bacterium]|nr:serine/threonine protein kinase [Pyrinomonadaceae bacterium]